jgi:hypothetical protein
MADGVGAGLGLAAGRRMERALEQLLEFGQAPAVRPEALSWGALPAVYWPPAWRDHPIAPPCVDDNSAV